MSAPTTGTQTTVEYVVSAPHYGYEGAGHGTATRSYGDEAAAESFARAVNIYRTVKPSAPDYLSAYLNPDADIEQDAFEAWEEVRDFGWDNGHLTGDAIVEAVTTTRRRIS